MKKLISVVLLVLIFCSTGSVAHAWAGSRPVTFKWPKFAPLFQSHSRPQKPTLIVSVEGSALRAAAKVAMKAP